MSVPILGGKEMSLLRTFPSMETVPFVGRIKPLIKRISIVFPEPFTPRKPTICPDVKTMEISVRISMPLIVLET